MRFSGVSTKEHLSFDFGFCNSLHRSLIAETEPRRDTDGLMQSRCRDDSGICFTHSSFTTPLLSFDGSVGIEVGKDGLLNSDINCVS